MLCCFSLGIVGIQMFLQLQHTKLQSLQQPTRDQLQQQDRTPHTLTHHSLQTHYNNKISTARHTYILRNMHNITVQISADKNAEQPHRLCIQQHSWALGARRHDFQGAEKLITHSLEPFSEKANRCMCNGTKFPLNALYQTKKWKEKKMLKALENRTDQY